MRGKKILGIGLSLVSMFLLGACGSNDKVDEDGVTADGKNQIEMWTFVQQHADFFKDAAETWNKENPEEEIELKVSVLPYDQMHQKLQVALNSGKGAPDITDIEISQFAALTKGNNVPLEPLNDAIQEDLPYLVESRLDNYKIDENYYGLDYHVGASMMFWNKEIMDEAGIDPLTIKTWDDYAEAGKVIKEKVGVPITDLNTTNAGQYFIMITQQKADIIKDGKSDVANEASEKAITYLNSLIYDYEVAGKAAGGHIDTEEFYPSFNEGNSASIFYPVWMMSRMVDYMPDLSGKILMTPLPVFEEGNDRSAGNGGTSTSVTNQARNKDLATRFVAYAKASKEGALKEWTMLGFDPIRTDVWEMDEMKADNKYTEYFGSDIFDTLLEVKDEIGTISYTSPAYTNVADKVTTDVLPNVLEENAISPTEALEKVDKELANQ